MSGISTNPAPVPSPPGYRVAVTGAGGKTGRAVIASLAATGCAVTAIVRRAALSDLVLADGATQAEVIDLLEPNRLQPVLSGVDAVYHIPPNMHPDEVLIAETTVDAAVGAGVERFVLHSVLAPFESAMPHHLRKARSEELVRHSSLAWTILQPASYAQNLLAYVAEAESSGMLQVPYSTSSLFSPVDLRDVAEVAAAVLVGEQAARHRYASYELCGPEVLTTEAMARQLGGLLGRDVRAEAGSPERWRAASDLPAQLRGDLAAMFGHYDRYGFVGGPFVLERLLGRPATRTVDALRRDLASRAADGGAPEPG